MHYRDRGHRGHISFKTWSYWDQSKIGENSTTLECLKFFWQAFKKYQTLGCEAAIWPTLHIFSSQCTTVCINTTSACSRASCLLIQPERGTPSSICKPPKRKLQQIWSHVMRDRVSRLQFSWEIGCLVRIKIFLLQHIDVPCFFGRRVSRGKAYFLVTKANVSGHDKDLSTTTY